MLETQLFASAIVFKCSQNLPPSEMKSLYGSIRRRPVISLSIFSCAIFSPSKHSRSRIEHCCSRRQLTARLLRRHVRGVPVGPVRVALPPAALLVLAMGGLRTPKSTREVACRPKRSHASVDAPGQSRRDLLQQPTVTIRIAE